MNRSDIIKAISQETGIPQNAITTVLDSLTISKALSDAANN